MFALEAFGLLLLVAVLVAVFRRRGDSNVDCGPMHPCLGEPLKREK
jgi:hypothetical protein